MKVRTTRLHHKEYEMTKSILLAVAAAGTLALSAQAHAGGHVAWSVGINLPPVGVAVGNAPVYAPAYPVYAPAPVYSPAPVYYESAPVYAPPPVYYRPAPVVYGAPYYGYRHHRYYNRPMPVYAPYPHARHW